MHFYLLIPLLLLLHGCQTEKVANEPDNMHVFSITKKVMSQIIPPEYKPLWTPITSRQKKITKGSADDENVPQGYYLIQWQQEVPDDTGAMAILGMQVMLKPKIDCDKYIEYDCYEEAQAIVMDQLFEFNTTMLSDLQAQDEAYALQRKDEQKAAKNKENNASHEL